MSAPKRILLVDDDPSIRAFMEMVLSDEGFDVLEAEDGEAALQAIDRLPPDLILLDMRMPVMDGWAFASAYQQRPGPRAPIIVLTAAPDAAARAAQIQADGYLPKPFNIDDLLTSVARFTGQV